VGVGVAMIFALAMIIGDFLAAAWGCSLVRYRRNGMRGACDE